VLILHAELWNKHKQAVPVSKTRFAMFAEQWFASKRKLRAWARRFDPVNRPLRGTAR
jgi:hypothetical protein